MTVHLHPSAGKLPGRRRGPLRHADPRFGGYAARRRPGDGAYPVMLSVTACPRRSSLSRRTTSFFKSRGRPRRTSRYCPGGSRPWLIPAAACQQTCGLGGGAIHQDWSGFVTPEHPAVAGEVLHFYGTGFGPVNPQGETGIPAPTCTADPPGSGPQGRALSRARARLPWLLPDGRADAIRVVAQRADSKHGLSPSIPFLRRRRDRRIRHNSRRRAETALRDPTGHCGRLPDPLRHLRLLELVVLMDVNVPHLLAL